MPSTREELTRDGAEVVLVQVGPQPGWPVRPGVVLRCPRCGSFVHTDRYDDCACGAISIDLDAGRISVSGFPEQTVEIHRVTPAPGPRRSP